MLKMRRGDYLRLAKLWIRQERLPVTVDQVFGNPILKKVFLQCVAAEKRADSVEFYAGSAVGEPKIRYQRM